MSLSRQKFFRKDFSGQDLSGQDLSHSDFICCKFDDADLSRANCSHSNFTGASLRNTKCTFTDFAHSCLACVFEPSDAYGITLTMHCNTFDQMRISKMWWYGFMFFATMMKVEKDPKLHTALKQFIGDDYYEKLQRLFKRTI